MRIICDRLQGVAIEKYTGRQCLEIRHHMLFPDIPIGIRIPLSSMHHTRVVD